MYSKIEPGVGRVRRSQYLPMKQSEAWSFVRSHYKMVLCTLDSHGFPHAAPVWYVVIDDKIYFRAQPYKKKIKNILKKPEVCAVVEDGDKYTELRGVMVQGLAKVVDTDKVLRKRVFDMLAEKYRSMRDTDRFPTSWQETYGKEHRVVVEFKPTKIVSWDNRKWLSRSD
jgi:PPOX class probable F420-dependent enzyme